MLKKTNTKSLNNFKDAKLTKEQAGKTNGSSSIISTHHNLNVGFHQQMKSMFSSLLGGGSSAQNEFSATQSKHTLHTNNLICYGNVNGLES